ncbi:MAG: Major Facilitator Superfamily protein [Candidatus Hydrogenedentes bacterium ADurb.Bin101]|nr:MAG: Major Facilitator Superfamily protein [Candidatus Hydrogenedentes bacterium ADurb.Bin101]
MMHLKQSTASVGFLMPPAKVALISFLFSAATASATMVMPFFVYNQLGRGAFLSGVFAGTQALGYTVLSLGSANYVARAKNGLSWGVIGIFGYMVLMCAMPLFRSPWVCGTLFCVACTVSALAWPCFHSWAGAAHALNERARYMGRVNVGWSTGSAAGPFLAGPLYEADYRLPYLFIAVLCLVSLYLILRVPSETAYFGKRTRETASMNAAHEQASESFLWCAWCATFTAHVCIGAVRAVFPKRLDDIVASGSLRVLFESDMSSWLNSLAATRFSWLAVSLGMATALMFLVLGRSGWWHHRFSVLVIAQLVAGLGMWTLGTTHSLVLMMIAFAILGANLGIAFFSSVYYGMADPARKHGRSAINEGVVGAGGILGAFGFAMGGARFGLDAPYHGMPVLIVLIILLQVFLIRKGKASRHLKPG